MTDLDDLWRDLNSVARLYGYCTDDQNAQKVARVCTEAAAALEALRAENERLREALAPLKIAGPVGTRFPVKGPCWQDLERRVPATVTGQTVAVAENALFWQGEWLTAVQEVPARRPVLEVMPNGDMELFFAKPDAGYSLATILTSGIMTFHVPPR